MEVKSTAPRIDRAVGRYSCRTLVWVRVNRYRMAGMCQISRMQEPFGKDRLDGRVVLLASHIKNMWGSCSRSVRKWRLWQEQGNSPEMVSQARNPSLRMRGERAAFQCRYTAAASFSSQGSRSRDMSKILACHWWSRPRLVISLRKSSRCSRGTRRGDVPRCRQ